MRPFVAGLALLAGSLLTSVRPAASQETRPHPPFSGYTTGTAIHADVLRAGTGGPTLVGAGVAVSAASVGSHGLEAALTDETGRLVQHGVPSGKRSYGRGAAVEATVAGGTPLARSLTVAGVSTEAAPPSAPPGTEELGPIRLPPLVYASAARSQAQPAWSDRTCVIGHPMGLGLGSVADVQLLDVDGQSLPGGAFNRPLLAADAGSPVDRAVTQSRSVTYLSPNADGTFALVSETRQTIAPVTLLRGSPNEVTIEVLGEWVLRAAANGKQGGGTVEYGPAADHGPATPVLRLLHAGQVTELTLQDLLGNPGLRLRLDPLVEIAVGEPPRPITGPGVTTDSSRAAQSSPDGTQAAAAVDVVRVNLLQPAPPGGPRVLQLRLGHMEARADVPAGGVTCRIPVRKDGAPAFVNPGEGFTWTISIPSASDAFDGLRCDLVDLKAVDVARATPGVVFTILSASHGGVVSGDSVTWPDLGRYRPGGRPVVLTVTGRLEPGSARGILSDTVDVTASLDNCSGGLPTPSPSGRPPGAVLRGSFTLAGPTAFPGHQSEIPVPGWPKPPRSRTRDGSAPEVIRSTGRAAARNSPQLAAHEEPSTTPALRRMRLRNRSPDTRGGPSVAIAMLVLVGATVLRRRPGDAEGCQPRPAK
jgi:hypothetical protein